MKNMLKITLVLTAFVSLLATSCVKDINPTGSGITLGQVNESPDAMKAMVKAIHAYECNYNSGWQGSAPQLYGYPAMCVVRDVWCQDMPGNETGYNWYEPFETNQYMNGIYAHMQIMWLWYTKWLALANDIIRMYPKIDEVPEHFRNYVGCAYAYRAWAWLDLGQMHEFKANNYTSKDGIEGLTIPYLHENITEAEARSNPRLPKADLLEKIFATLDVAIELLEGFTSDDKTMPTKAVAYGLQARAHLWAGDYAAARTSAENALAAGSFSPLTKEQWTNTTTGFNSAASNSSWMMCCTASKETNYVKNKVSNFVSWMAPEQSYGYTSYGTYRLADVRFYKTIPDTDFRKLSWKAPAGSTLEVPYLAADGAYKGPGAFPELTGVKFRPGQGDVNDYLTGGAVDYPMMRMEEMKFIIAECDAREGNSASLVEIVQTRNPEYTCSYTGNDLIREVFFQKRVEFWGEGVMFFDYKRCPDLLQITRGYKGTNHNPLARFNCEGLAPWMNVCINEYEAMDNTALTTTNNPDPSNAVELWTE